MFNAVEADTPSDPELAKKYKQCVKLAIDACQDTPGQFKLVKTPLKSFLLVSNIMPQDKRDWHGWMDTLDCEDNSPDILADNADERRISGEKGATYCKQYDFSSLSLRCARTHKPYTLEESSEHTYEHTSLECEQHTRSTGLPFAVYDGPILRAALSWNKDDIITGAMQLLAHPRTWTSLIPEDPLPWIWLLFYGSRSLCDSPHCMYKETVGRPGPMALPEMALRPEADIESFMGFVTRSVTGLYSDITEVGGLIPESVSIPFDPARLHRVIHQMGLLRCDSLHLSRVCLLCLIYKQNLTAQYKASLTAPSPCIMLVGEAAKYLVGDVGNYREYKTGSTVLFPTYDLKSMATDLLAHGHC
ncbi:ORF25 [callitrichine gammaherpesvirus 3]|uniref:ORF25 n=1 Tax=callitrichine gammaherpesvirus 3 TaxID=106331 RepID=Q993I5_9GAMA|nr:ORF25 [callitrichine gammaherpesvirus 3]AAK38233.1 ORF25 [callitrichine gammaherpesvirus 3]